MSLCIAVSDLLEEIGKKSQSMKGGEEGVQIMMEQCSNCFIYFTFLSSIFPLFLFVSPLKFCYQTRSNVNSTPKRVLLIVPLFILRVDFKFFFC